MKITQQGSGCRGVTVAALLGPGHCRKFLCWLTAVLLVALTMAAGAASGTCCTVSAGDAATVVRAAYDLGSSTTKVKVARVDPVDGRVLEVLLDESVRVGYQEALSRSADNAFDEAIMAEGLGVLRRLQAAAREFRPQRHIGVATAAFRAADNGERFVARLAAATGVRLRVISAREEAELGYRAAVRQLQLEPERAVVWDIGGGSMQLIAADGRGGYVFHPGRLASVTFRNAIIRDIQGRDLAQTQSPNPINAEVAARALELARNRAAGLPEFFERRFADPQVRVLGIGGVHYFSIRGQLRSGDQPYERADLEAAIQHRLGLDDTQIGGEFAATEVGNLILVLGHMQTWGIDRVQPLQVALADALLFE